MLLKKKGVWLASILVLNSWVGGALAAEKESATLHVKAQINPGSCELEFTGGNEGENTLNFGSVHISKLKNGVTTFPIKEIKLRITCAADTKFNLSATDDKKSTSESLEEGQWSLKDVSKNRIMGFYKINIGKEQVIATDINNSSGYNSNLSTSAKNDTTYIKIENSVALSPSHMNNNKTVISPTKIIDYVEKPTPVSSLIIPMKIEMMMNKINNDENIGSNVVNVEGGATFTIKYL